MKKSILISVSILLISVQLLAQNSKSFFYQGYARGSSGLALTNQSLEFRFTIYSSQENAAEFVEIHSGVITDENGVFNARIGTINTADFNVLNFNTTNYSLKAEVKDGGNYQMLSNELLLSVPYAKAAETSTNALTANSALNGCPVGTILSYIGSSAPSGWLLCDGSAFNRFDYPQLFAIIGISCGDGGAANSFNVPDLRGRFLRGFSGTSSADSNKNERFNLMNGGNSGNDIATYQNDATRFPANASTTNDGNHTHTYDDAFYSENFTNNAGKIGSDATDNNNDYYFRTPKPTTEEAGVHSHSLTGGDQETRPKNFSVNFIIKY